jgi:hypothetical protein
MRLSPATPGVVPGTNRCAAGTMRRVAIIGSHSCNYGLAAFGRHGPRTAEPCRARRRRSEFCAHGLGKYSRTATGYTTAVAMPLPLSIKPQTPTDAHSLAMAYPLPTSITAAQRLSRLSRTSLTHLNLLGPEADLASGGQDRNRVARYDGDSRSDACWVRELRVPRRRGAKQTLGGIGYFHWRATSAKP